MGVFVGSANDFFHPQTSSSQVSVLGHYSRLFYHVREYLSLWHKSTKAYLHVINQYKCNCHLNCQW